MIVIHALTGNLCISYNALKSNSLVIRCTLILLLEYDDLDESVFFIRLKYGTVRNGKMRKKK